MTMGPRQEAHLEQRAELKLDIQARLKQKVEVRLAFEQRLQTLLRETPDAPEKMLDDVIGRAIGALPAATQNAIKQAISGFTGLEASMMKHTELLALTNEQRLREFALNVIYTMQEGKFFDDDDSKDRRAPLADIAHALRDPTWATREISHIDGLIKTHAASVGGELLNSRARLFKASQLVELLGPHLDQLANVVRHILGARDPQTGEAVQICIREQAVSERFLPVASERIEQRLVGKMQKISVKDAPERFELATLNSIGETTLVGLGVLSPELFDIASLSEETRTDLDKKLFELGFTPEALQRLFSEKRRGGMFWHRWKTTTRKPGPLTDLAVREFITEHLRKDREAILDAAEYPKFFERAQSLADARRSEKDPEERAMISIDMSVHAMDMLGSERLHECLTKLTARSWYRDLDMFFQK